LYKIEGFIDRAIQTVIRKNILEGEQEVDYWERHWEQHILYYNKQQTPKEIEENWWKYLYDEMVMYYEHVLDGLEDKHICELGSGSGYASLLMGSKGAHVTLVDFSPKACEYAEIIHDYLLLDRERVNVILEDAFSKELNIGTYDVVWNCGVIEHYEWNQAVELIRVMMRHVDIGGKVMVTVPNLLSPELLYKMVIEGKGSEIFFSHRMLKKMMEEAGLQQVEIHPINYWVPSFLPAMWANKMRKINLCKYIKSMAWLFNGIGT